VRRALAAALGGGGLVLAALTFEAQLLFVPGIALVLVGLAAPAWVAVAGASVRVTRRLHADRVDEGQPIEATLEVRHGALGLPGCVIEEPLASRPLALTLRGARLRGGRTELRVVARFERRGRRVLPAPRLALRDPLGIASLTRAGRGAGQEVLVLPRIVRPRALPGAATDPLSRAERAGSPEPLAATDVDGLRAYRAGTPASRIHWLALARGAGLLERRLRADSGLGPLVVLDARCSAPGEPLEAAVRAAASLSHELARRGGCELLLPGERRPIRIEHELGAWPGAHARLALIDGGPAAPAPAVLPRAGRVFYVAAEPPARGGGWLEHAAGVVLVLPASRAAAVRRPAVLEVAGCVGVLLGEGGARRAPAPGRLAVGEAAG